MPSVEVLPGYMYCKTLFTLSYMESLCSLLFLKYNSSHHFMKCHEIPADVKTEFKNFKRQHSSKSGDYWEASCHRKGLYDGANTGPSSAGIRLKPKEQAKEERQQQETMKELLSAGPADFKPDHLTSSDGGQSEEEDYDDAAADAAAVEAEAKQEVLENHDLDSADLDEFMTIIEPEPLDDLDCLEPLPFRDTSSPASSGNMSTTSTSKRRRPDDRWHQAATAKYASSFGAYRDNDDDAYLPSVASSCTGTYSTGATTYYSTSSRYNNATASPSSSRSTSATADLFESLNMMHGDLQ